MHTNFLNLVVRDSTSPPLGQSMLDAIIVLLGLIILALLLAGALIYTRQRRRTRRRAALVQDVEKRLPTSSASSHRRRVNDRPSQSVYDYQEERNLIDKSPRPPSSSSHLPEIRITFPEEVDVSGKRQSGRVVVVKLGDSCVGLGPAERLPSYTVDGQRFHSIDLERVGGLVEKARNAPLGWDDMR